MAEITTREELRELRARAMWQADGPHMPWDHDRYHAMAEATMKAEEAAGLDPLTLKAALAEAEDLADDLENQNAELCMGLDDAQGRVAGMSHAIARYLPTLPQDSDGNFQSGDAEILAQALTSDSSRIMDVVKADHDPH